VLVILKLNTHKHTRAHAHTVRRRRRVPSVNKKSAAAARQ